MATKRKTKSETPAETQVETQTETKKEKKYSVVSDFQYKGKKYLKGNEFEFGGIAEIETLVKQGLIK